MTLSQRLYWTLRIYAHGKEYARSSEWLSACLGCTRRQLQYARKGLEHDYPILSDHDGYWISDDPHEYSAVISLATKNLRAERSRVDDLKFCLTKTWPDYQPTLWEVA